MTTSIKQERQRAIASALRIQTGLSAALGPAAYRLYESFRKCGEDLPLELHSQHAIVQTKIALTRKLIQEAVQETKTLSEMVKIQNLIERLETSKKISVETQNEATPP